VKAEIVPTLDAVLAAHHDEAIGRARADISKLKSHRSMRDLALVTAPHQYIGHDSHAMQGGLQIPPHIQVQARLAEQFSYGSAVADLGKQVRYISTYLQKRHKMKGNSVGRTDGKIFIGHGRSATWRDLKDFIQDRLRLQWDEFNREPTAGKSTKERLEEMLDASSFAFLVMTAEDETPDGKWQARANVIHEVGLFQGRLGFERAIVLLEHGCEEFSNITGITQIRFLKGNVRAIFEDIRQVLERENIRG
jgi:predicted nucleotide-binding protein